MGKWLLRILGLLALGCRLGSAQAAELDEVQSHLLQQYRLPLRWESVKDDPGWLAGPRPSCVPDADLPVVRLEPRAAVLFRIPPLALLRVFNPHGKLEPQDLDLSFSNGSGLFVSLPAEPSVDGRSLVVAPCSVDSLVARVVRRSAPCQPIAVAFFMSRPAPLAEIAPYRGLVKLCGPPPVRIRGCDEAVGQEYWRIAPSQPLSVDLTGPGRLAVETRLEYPPQESRSFQAYRIALALDGRPHQVLEYATTVEDRLQVLVAGCAAVLGKPEIAYVELPEGKHRLTLDATASLYLRLLRQEQPDYLVPKLNQSPSPYPLPLRGGEGRVRGLSAAQVRQQGVAQVLHLSPWDLNKEQAAWIAGAGPLLVAEKERLALRLVRDNRYRDGGLVGAMLMSDLSVARPDYPRVAVVAEKLRAAHTFYRDLLPLTKSTSKPQEFGWFVTRRLLNPGEKACATSLPAQLREDALDNLSSALLVNLPTQAADALIYPVPERFAPTCLRVVVAGKGPCEPGEIFVQFDHKPPLRLYAFPGLDLPLKEFLPSRAELALSSLPGPTGRPENATLGGPFARWHVPGPLLPAGYVEVPLPPDVKTVRVWQSAGAPGLRVALQYRAAEPYRLSETAYLEALRRVGGEAAQYQAFAALLTSTAASEGAPDALRELANHWIPLFRLLRARDQQFRAAVVPAPLPAPDPPLDDAARAALHQRALQLEKQGQRLAALEAWTSLLATGDRTYRRPALLGRVAALEALGEQHLAERQLRALFLYDPDETVQDQARERLGQIYARANDAEALEALHAVAALRRPTPERLRSLAEALLASGEVEMALLVGLCIPPPERPLETLLRAAYQVRWWQVFECLRAQLPTVQAQSWWQAQRLLTGGQEQEALQLLRQAGTRGQPVAASLETAMAIRTGLASPEPATRATAVLDWEKWQAEHPGPHTWREDASLVVDYRGAESVYAIARDLYTRYYLASPDRPVKLQVAGPLRLRLEVRPLHPRGSIAPLNDWLHIRQPGLLRSIPIINNFPSDGLRLTGDPTKVPGTKVTWEGDVGPGLQEIDVAGARQPVLVRVEVLRPEMPLGILPFLSRDALVAVWAGDGPTAADSTGKLWKHQEERSSTSLELQQAALLAQGQLEKALALPIGEGDAAVLRRMMLLLHIAESKPEQRARAQALGEALFAAHPDVAGLQSVYGRLTQRSNWVPVTTVRGGVGLRQIEVMGYAPDSLELRARKALLQSFAPTEQAVTSYERFLLSLTLLRPTVLTLDLSLDEVAHLPPLPLTAVYQLDEERENKVVLTPQSPRQVRQVVVPAGAHSVRVWIAQPLANQFLRIRVQELRPDLFLTEKVLAGITQSAQAAVTPPLLPSAALPGYQELRPDRDLVRKRDLTYHIATPQQPLQVTVEGPAWLRVDELRDGTITSRFHLVASGRQTIELKPEPGQKEALFRIAQRFPAPDEPVAAPRHVPWHPEPVPPPLIDLTGKPPCPPEPEVVPDASITWRAARSASAAPLTLPSPPSEGGEVRVRGAAAHPAKRDASAASLGAPIVRPQERPDTSPSPSFPIAPSPPAPCPAVPGDPFPLPPPQGSTWSATVEYRKRRALDEVPEVLVPDQFLEFRATNRCYDEWRRTYFETDFLGRIRESSGPTLGLREYLRYQPYCVPLIFHLEGSGYLQRPSGAIVGDGELEWSLLLRGAVSQNYEITPKLTSTPSLMTFGRLLSMDQNNYLPGRVDQDIFTQYKSTHRAGWELADRLNYRPWLDTIWWGRAGLVSNEEFITLDHAAFQVGWKQLLGGAQVNADYRLIQFFADNDRPRAVTRHLLGCDLLWEHLTARGARLEFGFRLEHDLTRDRNSLLAFLSWYFANGREYRDFRPGTIDFPDLRRRRFATTGISNWIGQFE